MFQNIPIGIGFFLFSFLISWIDFMVKWEGGWTKKNIIILNLAFVEFSTLPFSIFFLWNIENSFVQFAFNLNFIFLTISNMIFLSREKFLNWESSLIISRHSNKSLSNMYTLSKKNSFNLSPTAVNQNKPRPSLQNSKNTYIKYFSRIFKLPPTNTYNCSYYKTEYKTSIVI